MPSFVETSNIIDERTNNFLQYFMNIAILKAKTRTGYKNQVKIFYLLE